MSFGERAGVRTQSIESHHRQLGELAERCGELAERQDRVTEIMESFGRRVAKPAGTTQLNFDWLTQAMTGLTNHVAGHQRRLENLER